MKKRFTLRTILNLFIVCLFVSLIQKFIIELSHKELLYHNNNKPNFNHNQQKWHSLQNKTCKKYVPIQNFYFMLNWFKWIWHFLIRWTEHINDWSFTKWISSHKKYSW
jgi:hypothetical protein